MPPLENDNLKELIMWVSKTVSIGVGSAVVTVCKDKGLDPNNIKDSDIPELKKAITRYFQQFWVKKVEEDGDSGIKWE